jgi:hypothetical protein
MEWVDIWGDDFVCRYEAFQLHAERGGLVGSNEKVTTKRVVKVWREGSNIDTGGAAVSVFTVRANTTSENRGAVVTHVEESVNELRRERMARGGGDTLVAHPFFSKNKFYSVKSISTP